MRTYNVVFTETVEHIVCVDADSASEAAFKAIVQVRHDGPKPWEFLCVEARGEADYVNEVIV